MRLSDFDFELDEELIAQHPPERRDAARMLVVDRASGSWRDENFAQLPSLLRPDDLVVLNNTRVFPARLVGERVPSGGRVELLLVGELSDGELSDGELSDGELSGAERAHTWAALVRPARKLSPGARVAFGADKRLRAEVLEILPDGKRVVRFECDGDFDAALRAIGRTPLPPYIKRDAAQVDRAEDRERYQTVFASRRGAIAA
ncbi:MAG: S-adenosylmethionine:tRNA ribosyltransferase-isomerase, partial [Pyrinomonadaceae bacterium]